MPQKVLVIKERAQGPLSPSMPSVVGLRFHKQPWRPKMLSLVCYQQHCVQRKVPVFKLLRGQFWSFLPHMGYTLHLWQWSLAWKSGQNDQISPYRCKDKGTEQNIFICLNKATQFTTHRKQQAGSTMLEAPIATFTKKSIHAKYTRNKKIDRRGWKKGQSMHHNTPR